MPKQKTKVKSNPASGLRWFAGKSIITTRAIGKPRKPNRYYNPQNILLEERICLFKARSFDEALRKTELEATHFCRQVFTHQDINPYGQELVVDIASLNVYEMADQPGEDAEIFSTCWIMKKGDLNHLLAQQHKNLRGEATSRRTRYFCGTKPGK